MWDRDDRYVTPPTKADSAVLLPATVNIRYTSIDACTVMGIAFSSILCHLTVSVYHDVVKRRSGYHRVNASLDSVRLTMSSPHQRS